MSESPGRLWIMASNMSLKGLHLVLSPSKVGSCCVGSFGSSLLAVALETGGALPTVVVIIVGAIGMPNVPVSKDADAVENADVDDNEGAVPELAGIAETVVGRLAEIGVTMEEAEMGMLPGVDATTEEAVALGIDAFAASDLALLI